MKAIPACAALACAVLSVGGKPAAADDATPAPAAPASAAMTMPAMAGPLAANPNPTSFDAGPFGKVYVTGVLSGIGQWQTNTVPGTAGNRSTAADLSNGQVFIQKTDGLVQYFIQAGAYSLPALGTPYLDAAHTTVDFFGPVPQAYIKLAPSDNFSVMAGKLPTLIGAEYTFSFENMNIERGLLWNQENAVNRGVQVNYTAGPVAFALSWNDGFYSDNLSWITGSATWTIGSADTLAFAAGANTQTTTVSTLATPVFLNNEQIYNLIYTHTSGPWTFNPYLQYTYVPRTPAIGALNNAATYGAALLANYTFDPAAKLGGMSLAGFSLPFRLEYITATGSAGSGAPNVLYGPGSNAWSLTITPTYQYKIFFTRAEFSYVGASHTTAGDAFGPAGTNTSQARLLIESGFIF